MRKYRKFPFIQNWQARQSDTHSAVLLCKTACWGEVLNPPEQLRTGVDCAFPWNASHRPLAY